MKLTLTLNCEGFQRTCTAAISTGLRDSDGNPAIGLSDGDMPVTVDALTISARNGNWDVRPVATRVDAGALGHTDSETVKAWCRDCARRLHSWAAEAILKQMNLAPSTMLPGPVTLDTETTLPACCADGTFCDRHYNRELDRAIAAEDRPEPPQSTR